MDTCKIKHKKVSNMLPVVFVILVFVTGSVSAAVIPGTPIWGPKPLPSFPADGWVYGLAYDPGGDQLFVCDVYSRSLRRYSSDSNVTYLGAITAPDTFIADISYSAYDDNLWVTGFMGNKCVWKISKTGTVYHYFTSPANDYGCGLTFDGQDLWLADRRTNMADPKYIYISDTLGNATQYDDPIQGHYSARCLTYDTLGHSFPHVNTFFDSDPLALDSAGVYELQGVPPVWTGNKFLVPSGWNIRGIEFDPRDGNYWITIPQGAGVDNSIVKVQGFYIQATIDFDPNTLNLNSRGRWITCYIELPEGYAVEDIDTNTVAITAIDGESLEPPLYRVGPTGIGDEDEDSIPDLMVKFGRQDLIDILGEMVEPPAYVELTVSGELANGTVFGCSKSGHDVFEPLGRGTSDGTVFAGVDTIRVIRRRIPSIGPQSAGEIPHVFALYEIYPNPFSSNTVIRYALPTNTRVMLNIYDANGRVVKSLVNSGVAAGYHNIDWDGCDNSGKKLPSGVYFLEFEAGDYTETKKLILLR